MNPATNRATMSDSADAHSQNAESVEARSRLYREIMDFDIDGEPVEASFVRRLARENGWRLGYARQVVIEYKRFMYLAMTAGHPVSPSSVVDKAWHLHLTYTVSYWERFCRNLLGRMIHHHPSQGSLIEARKYNSQYAQTLSSYQRVFGEHPDASFWPRPLDCADEVPPLPPQNQIRNWISLDFVNNAFPLNLRLAFMGIIVAISLILPLLYLSYSQISMENEDITATRQADTSFIASNNQPILPKRVQTVVISPKDTTSTLDHSGPYDRQYSNNIGPTFDLKQSTPNNTKILSIGIIFIVLSVSYLFWRIFGGICLACGRLHALEKTDSTRHGEMQFRCKYCGFAYWEKETSCG